MKQPIGRCIICERFGKMWRCVDITGGGTFYGVCFECRDIPLRRQERIVSLLWLLTTSLIVNVLFMMFVLFITYNVK